jgi:glutaminyl-peptide cyclotransferase
LVVKVNLRHAAEFAFASVLFAVCGASFGEEPRACERGWRVVDTLPHDRADFTQGLAIRDGVLFESTGLYGASTVQRKELRTGKVLSRHDLPNDLFGEGLTRVGSKLYQLTWKEQIGTVYDLDLQPIATFRYDGEGWGAATLPTLAGERLVLSNGSHQLRIVDPDTMTIDWVIDVRDAGIPVERLNELEFVKGEILANVWKSDRVAAIDPYTGKVKGWYDLASLREHLHRPDGYSAENDVLNGLALDPASGHVFATGKRWPALFELDLGGCRVDKR